MQSMRATRASGKPFTVFARNLVEESKGDKGTLRSALEYLVIAAGCNGRIEPKQTIMLEVACNEFGFNPA